MFYAPELGEVIEDEVDDLLLEEDRRRLVRRLFLSVEHAAA